MITKIISDCLYFGNYLGAKCALEIIKLLSLNKIISIFINYFYIKFLYKFNYLYQIVTGLDYYEIVLFSITFLLLWKFVSKNLESAEKKLFIASYVLLVLNIVGRLLPNGWGIC